MTSSNGSPGHDDRARCGGATRGGGSCTQAAGWGTDHPGFGRCKLHGGSTPSHRRNAEKHAAEQAVALYGLPIDISPAEALLEEVRWTAGHVAWLRIRVQKITESDLVWGVTQQVEKDSGGFPGTDTTKAAAPNVWLDLYDRERKHLVGVCAAALKAGVEERRVRLAEQQGALVADVIRRVLDDLDLSEEQQALVPTVVPRQLRAITADEGVGRG